MTDISVSKNWPVGVKSLGDHNNNQKQAIFGKICAKNLRSMDKLPLIDSLSPFIHHKKPHKICFVGLKCQTCRDLCTFLGVKSGLVILVRVKDLTFSNSACGQASPGWDTPPFSFSTI